MGIPQSRQEGKEARDAELDVFYGNRIEYHNFMTQFHELVKKRIDDPRGRLTQLIRYTRDDPKGMIQHYVQYPPAVGYKNTKKSLDQVYRNSYNIMGVYRKKIKSWSHIRKGDEESYQKFNTFLMKCESI